MLPIKINVSFCVYVSVFSFYAKIRIPTIFQAYYRNCFS
ncbi:hypothetical protein M070_0534 [Bacteroides fragilis str. A7 (UDC12-2)]|nr:hypothetical protein M146_0690 [Bacteroides fragilis str. 1007-1-F \